MLISFDKKGGRQKYLKVCERYRSTPIVIAYLKNFGDFASEPS